MANRIDPNDPNLQLQNPDVSQIVLPPVPAPGFAAHMANPANMAAIAPSVAPRSVVTPSNVTPKPAGLFHAGSNWFAPALTVNTAGMGAAPLPSVTPAVTQPVQSQTDVDRAELQRRQANGAGLNQIHNGFLRGLVRTADIAASILTPGIAAQLPGTTLHNRVLQNQLQGMVAQDQNNDQILQQRYHQDIANQASQAKAALENSQAVLADRKSDYYTPVTVTGEQAAAIGMPQLEGTELDHRSLSNLLAGQQKGTKQSGIQAGKNQTAENVQKTRSEAAKAIQDSRAKTQALVQGMKSARSPANTSARLAGETEGRSYKVRADVMKRAALASDVNENADAVADLVTRRPDIVGSAGGRYSSVQQMIGSDAPDIQALGVRIHNIALASNRAHGVRSAEAVQKTENELFNNFKSGPQGIKGGLDATRQSVQTFLDDESNFQNSGRHTGGLNAPMPGGNKPETKQYQGHTYVKGPQGWHLR